jgi:transcriptional regulator with XRE-family HTH domain
MDIHKFIAIRILALCQERHITPNALSRIAGVPPSTIKNILNGKSKNPRVTTLQKLCNGLKISLTEFFDGESA